MEKKRTRIGIGGLSRRGALKSALFAGAVAALPGGVAAQTGRPRSASPWLLWYRQPAAYWVEALPIGNGRLGAMCFGDPARERLQLNEDSFWAGGPYDPSRSDALPALGEVRRLIFAGAYAEAQELAQQRLMAQPIRQMSYQTLGDLFIEMPGQSDFEDYVRWLDLDTATVETRWTSGGGAFRRRVYASVPDQLLIVDLDADKPFDLTLHLGEGSEVRGKDVWRTGRNTGEHGIDGALRYAIGARIIGADGSVTPRSGSIAIEGTSSATLLVAMRTSYRDWRRTDGDPEAQVARDLDAGARATGPHERHVAEHRRLFRGFDIDLGQDPFPDVPTDERIRYSHEQGRDDSYLAALYVQYARYLLISSSRPGCQPANLQGLWNDSGSPPWGSKYTININTEMNYWPAEPMGLAECTEPLIRMVEELAESGARTAKSNYGARGWVAHHNTDLWRATAPIDGVLWGMWPTGGAWLCKHLWDRWDYSRDPVVLKRIYPVMRDAGIFFLDALVELPDGSGLVTVPSLSPENMHHPGVTICAGPAMDRQILRELFDNIASAADLLKRDAALAAQFRAAAARLPRDRVGKAGQLQEWLEDWDMDVPEIQHRHVSHLFAVHPGHAIGPETPDLHAAAARSLAIRGDDATGWGIGWRINLWARLGNGARAYTVLRKLLGPDRTYPNMFDAHPPFQIDGNFGGAAGVLEMIVRDRPQLLELLPALPRAWPTGSVTGVRLRGGLSADIRWRDGQLISARLTARMPVERDLRHGDKTMRVRLAAGETMSL